MTLGCILWEELGHAEEGVQGGTWQGHSQGDFRGHRPMFLPQLTYEFTSGLPLDPSCLLPSILTGKEREEEHGLDKRVFLTFSLFSFSFPVWETKCFWVKAEEHLALRTESSLYSCRTALIPPLISLSASKICGLLCGAGIFCSERDCLVWSLFSLYHKNEWLFFFFLFLFPSSFSPNKGGPFGFHNSDHLTPSWNVHLGSRAQSLPRLLPGWAMPGPGATLVSLQPLPKPACCAAYGAEIYSEDNPGPCLSVHWEAVSMFISTE